ncbi:MAG TPA: hypothetical protein VGK41_01350 [Solirubrobacterales bacterium]
MANPTDPNERAARELLSEEYRAAGQEAMAKRFEEKGACDGERYAIRAIARALSHAAAVEGELAALREFFDAFMKHNATGPSMARLCNARDSVLKLREATPQPAPAAVAGGELTDERIERALDTPVGLDHTLRKLIRGDTVAVGYSKADVVRKLLQALAAQPAAGDSALEREVRYWLDNLPGAVRVREGGGDECLAKSFALNVVRLETAAQRPGAGDARPLSEYHEDKGPVVWWTFPVDEPAWIGSPSDSDWPGYHTHWTPHPAIPSQPASGGGG